jgi:hypothetical protein
MIIKTNFGSFENSLYKTSSSSQAALVAMESSIGASASRACAYGGG